jgi:hypothetical protein
MQYLNKNPCTQQCCKIHDDCYTTYRCNASSWIGFLYLRLPGPCQMCNYQAVGCMVKNVWRNPKCCS